MITVYVTNIIKCAGYLPLSVEYDVRKYDLLV